MKKILFFIMILGIISNISAQVHLNNNSFEGPPQDATVPMGWHACAPGSTPDILPGEWGVYTESSSGDTYMGLITRADGSWESVGQRLSEPLTTGECFNFSMDLAHSKTYAGYNKPVKLRIWGGVENCGMNQLLGETEFIKHTDWKRYHFKFVTDAEINYIILEAYYMDGIYFHYNGNILIDNCAAITFCRRASAEPIEVKFAPNANQGIRRF